MAGIDIESALLAQAHITAAAMISMDMLLVIAARSLYAGLQKQNNIFDNKHMRHAQFVAKLHVFWQYICILFQWPESVSFKSLLKKDTSPRCHLRKAVHLILSSNN